MLVFDRNKSKIPVFRKNKSKVAVSGKNNGEKEIVKFGINDNNKELAKKLKKSNKKLFQKIFNTREYFYFLKASF